MTIKNDQSGRTMIEVIGMLAIVGAVTSGIAHLISTMHDRFLLSRIVQQARDLQKVVSNRFVADGDYSGAENSILVSERAAPQDMIDGDSLYHAYRGAVTVSGTKDTFKISFEDLPNVVCMELATLNWQVGNDSDLISCQINDDLYQWPLAAGTDSKVLPLSMADALLSCTNLTSLDDDGNETTRPDNDNTVTWEFK